MTHNIDVYHRRGQNIVQAQQYRNNDDDDNDDINIFEKMQNRIDEFFSKGYNIVRFIFFIIIMLFLLYTFVTAMASVPEGESLTISAFFSQIAKNFNALRENFPMFEYIYSKISNLISAKQVNFLIFLSTMLGTIIILMCFCP